MATSISKPKTRFGKFIDTLVDKFTTLIAIVLGMFLLGFLIMLLWNYLFPVLFGLPYITYWQAVAMGLLARLLFGFG